MRHLLFSADHQPRSMFRKSIVNRHGTPRRAFAAWMLEMARDLSPHVSHLHFPDLPDEDRRVVLVVVGGKANTRPPVAGQELISHLSLRYQVVVIPIDAAAAESHGRAAGAAVTPLRPQDLRPLIFDALSQVAIARYRPLYAVAVGAETALAVTALEARGVPVVALVCERPAPAAAAPPTESFLEQASEIAFVGPNVADAVLSAFPRIARRERLHVLADAGHTIDDDVAAIDAFGTYAAGRVDADIAAVLAGDADGLEMLQASDETGTALPALLRERVVLWRKNRVRRVSLPMDKADRPYAGFSPLIYAENHPVSCLLEKRYPLAHWIESGKPEGPWQHPIITPQDGSAGDVSTLRVALHGHFHYVDLAPELLERIERNSIRPDLFFTTDTLEKAVFLQELLAAYPAMARIDVVPNRGRDIGPFLTSLHEDILDGGYDLFFHVHGKKSQTSRKPIGDPWRSFLWDNLIGDAFPMIDVIAARFSAQPSLGLAFPEDPNLVGWEKDRALAEGLLARMSIDAELFECVEFPIGNMFAARPSALAPLMALGLSWDDYPAEPVPYDGTILHAIERILPTVVAHGGFEVAGIRVPGTYW